MTKREERYEIISTLQQGQFASSYKAKDRVLDRLVLLKVLHPRIAADHDLVQRFRREALLQARLKHPNIVTIYDFGKEEEDFYIASEFIEGEPLDKLLARKRRLTLSELAPIVADVCRALAHAHAEGIVHRDLKPANVLVTGAVRRESLRESEIRTGVSGVAPDSGRPTPGAERRESEASPLKPQPVSDTILPEVSGVAPDSGRPTPGAAKLADFGLAFCRDMGQLTQEGCVIGTPAYMSPEQSRGKKTDERTDIFSLGVIVYEALSGKNPFAADSVAESLTLVLTKEPEPLSELAPDVPDVISALVMRMLSKDPQNRPASASEVGRVFLSLSHSALGVQSFRPVRQVLVPSLGLLLAAAAAAAFLPLKPVRAPMRTLPADSALSIALPDTARVAPDSANTGSVPAPALRSPVPGASRRESLREPEVRPGASGVAPDFRRPTPGAERRESAASPLKPQPVSDTILPGASGVAPDFGRLTPGSSVPIRSRFCLTRIVVSPWAEVKINGQYFGVTPFTEPLMLPLGRHVLELRNPFYPTLTKTLTLTDSARNITIDLSREFALLDIRVTPWAVVFLDGAMIDTTPLTRPVPVSLGKHTITLLHPELGRLDKEVNADTAGRYRLAYDMTR